MHASDPELAQTAFSLATDYIQSITQKYHTELLLLVLIGAYLTLERTSAVCVMQHRLLTHYVFH